MYFQKLNTRFACSVATLLLAAGLAGCDSNDGDSLGIAESGKPLGEFKIAYVKRSNDSIGNPLDAGRFRNGGNLFVRDLSAGAAEEKNITGELTKINGDVSDIEVSYDGTRIIFSMCFDDQTWDIWEYNVETGELRPIMADDADADLGDDHDPVYLPDGRIVFSSNRQTRSAFLQFQGGVPRPYKYRDESQREYTSVLHVMDPDGSNIRQLSYNQSHDRNPTVLRNGKIMYSRWDHFGNRNHMPIYTMNPDGSEVDALYGVFSGINSFLHPREMVNGKVLSTAMPLADTFEGGALMELDVKNFIENDLRAPVDSDAPGFDPNFVLPADAQGQRQVTFNLINTGKGISGGGRYTAPHPLWDGSNRALVAWSPSQPDEEAINPLTGELEVKEGPPVYGLYMLNLSDKSQQPIVLPKVGSGQSIVEGVAIQPRAPADIPAVIEAPDRSGTLADRGLALLNVKSVYDTDELGSMGQGMLVGNEAIPLIPAPEGDRRATIADINQLKDPTSVFRNNTATKRPARFVRVTKAVPTPSAMNKDSISANDMEMQQIVGYGEVQPDGSVKVEVPAETPIAVSVLDDQGRAIQIHTNWLNLQRGEELTCNGCHSPRRGDAINDAQFTGDHPNTRVAGQATEGETMADTRGRFNPVNLQLTEDIVFRDFWSDATTPTGPELDITIDYEGLTTPVPVNGLINYTEHIQPLWNKSCVSCHSSGSPEAGLDLSATLDTSPGGNGRMASYNGLTVGAPIRSGDGNLTVIDEAGNIDIPRNPAIVEQGSSADGSRASRLIELIYGEELRAEGGLSGTNHAVFNASERRLVTEWVDLGAQYGNTPFVRAADNPGGSPGELLLGTFRDTAPELDMAEFTTNVYPILRERCADCHQPRGDASELAPAAANLGPGAYILTGDIRGDLNMTLAMLGDNTDPAATPLLARAASNGAEGNPVHPLIFSEAGQMPSLSTDSADYQILFNWISGAGP